MRIVFVGAVDFSRHCLETLLRLQAEVVAVVTVAPEKSHLNSDYVDLGPIAARHNMPLLRVRQISSPENVEWIRAQRPDVVCVFGFSQLLSPELLSVAPLGCLGTHPALLPRNRGRHPIIWALVEGLTETGLTFLYLDEGVDSGDILWQRPVAIAPDDDAGSLYVKIRDLAQVAIAEFLPQLQAGTAPRTPQDHSRATYWRKRTEADGLIDWTASSQTIHNLIRGLARPYVGAHMLQNGQRSVVWKSRLPTTPVPNDLVDHPAGTMRLQLDGSVAVRTGDGWLLVLEMESQVVKKNAA